MFRGTGRRTALQPSWRWPQSSQRGLDAPGNLGFDVRCFFGGRAETCCGYRRNGCPACASYRNSHLYTACASGRCTFAGRGSAFSGCCQSRSCRCRSFTRGLLSSQYSSDCSASRLSIARRGMLLQASCASARMPLLSSSSLSTLQEMVSNSIQANYSASISLANGCWHSASLDFPRSGVTSLPFRMEAWSSDWKTGASNERLFPIRSEISHSRLERLLPAVSTFLVSMAML